MARRKKGRPVSGFLVLDKPVGLGSTPAVGKARWAFEAQKAGHAGTLDPLASGVLVIALGEATKIIPYVTDDLKAYEFTVRWGIATATDDTEGEVIATSDLRPNEEAIRAALPAFTGDIEQVPPAFSAVKVDGERAYDLARAGQEVTLTARPLFVESLTLLDCPDADHARFEMVCGKGGYVRSIARDLGQALGCNGHVTALRRTWSGPFDLSQSITPEILEDEARTPSLDARLLPLSAGLARLPMVHLGAVEAAQVRQGNAVNVAATNAELGETCWATHQGRALAIGTYGAGRFSPSRVLKDLGPSSTG